MKLVDFLLVVVIFCVAILVAFKSPQELPSAVKPPSYTPAQIEKGRYLVQIMGCADCHAPKKMTAQGPIPDPDLGLSGHPAQIPVPRVSQDALANWVLFSPMSTLAIGVLRFLPILLLTLRVLVLGRKHSL
jgi:hypothetical protein